MLSNAAGFGTGQEVVCDDALAQRLIERGKAEEAKQAVPSADKMVRTTETKAARKNTFGTG